MNTNDIQIGLRVRIASNDMTALVVGKPEYYTPRAKLARIQYENSTLYEYMLRNHITALPSDEQSVALGGSSVRPVTSLCS